jgi:plastocyanin
MEATMRTMRAGAVVLALLVSCWAVGNLVVRAQVAGNDNNIAIMDNCLPGDPGWNPTGGCTLKPHQGDVPFAEFGALLASPLTNPPNGFLIGHPSWRNEPPYVTVGEGKVVQVTNKGGRAHTFTKVADFGGGFVPQLNIGLVPAPECNPAVPNGLVLLPPGATDSVAGLAAGLYKFQCCIHPWMHAAIKVE